MSQHRIDVIEIGPVHPHPNADRMAEGVVIVPEKERWHPEIGRVCLKAVSNRYLEKS